MNPLSALIAWLIHPIVNRCAMQYPKVFCGAHRVTIHPTANVCNALFNASSGNISVGRHAFFGHNVMVLAARHDMTQSDAARQTAIPETGSDIEIGVAAWICSGAILCGPCKIGDHAVVGAGSVVTSDVPAGTFVAGNPAVVVRRITFAPLDPMKGHGG